MRALAKQMGGVIAALPYGWLLLFFAVPFLMVLKISFAEPASAIPPYLPLWSYGDGILNLKLNLGNFQFIADDPLYVSAYLQSLKVAAISTFLCLCLGYPMAYAIAEASPEARVGLMLLIMMPTWTAILIRVYAWMGILSNNGLLNGFLLWAGLIDAPLEILNTDAAVYIGIVYSYLPFMIMPLYANLVKHDRSLIEAAQDLGAGRIKSFWQITVPLSKSGVLAGSMLVFIPVIGEFVIPELMGGPGTLMIGKVLWQEFFTNRDWPIASSLAVIMLAILVVPILVFNRAQTRNAEHH